MAATPQELAALNGVISSVNNILDEAESINDHPIESPINLSSYGLFQDGANPPKRVSIQEIVDSASLPPLTGSEGDVLIQIGGVISNVSGFNYDAVTDELSFPMTIITSDINVGPANETVDFEGGDFSGTGFTTDGDSNWFVDGADPYEGSLSARSGAISNLEESYLYKTVSLSDAENLIKFAVFSDTEKDGDVLDFYINTTQTSGVLVVGEKYIISNYISSDDFTNVGAPSNATGIKFIATGSTPATWSNGSSLDIEQFVDSFSGNIPWKEVFYPVISGDYNLKWVYKKDPNASVGSDKVQIDSFQTFELISSSKFNGLNQFNDLSIFRNIIEFRGKVIGQAVFNNDIIVSGIKIGSGSGKVNTNIVIDSVVNNSGQLLTIDSATITAIGANVLSSGKTCKNISVFGSNVGRDIDNGSFLSGFGQGTLKGIVDGTDVVGLGRTTSDLPSNMSNTFFVNIAGSRMFTGSFDDGTGIPLQTNTLIDIAATVDPTLPPPTEVLNDVYYLNPDIIGSVDANWDGALKGTSVTYDGGSWVLSSAHGGKSVVTREYFEQYTSENIIEPTQITSDQDDYNPSGFDTINRGLMILDLSGNFDITGFAIMPNGFRFKVINSQASGGDIKFKNNSGSSSVGGRIFLDADLNLMPNQIASFIKIDSIDGGNGGYYCYSTQQN